MSPRSSQPLDELFSSIFGDLFSQPPNPDYEEPEYFRLTKELDTGFPPIFEFLQPYVEEILRRIANVLSGVWDFFQDKLREALEWLWGNIAYPLVIFSIDVWLITDEWTRGWGEPWRSIGRLLLFPAAFAYKGFRDYVGPALSNAVNEVKRYFDGAVGGVFDAVRNAFSPIFKPLEDFANTVYDFLTKTLPDWLKSAAEFFTSLPQRIVDLYNWIREKFEVGWTGLVEFFTKTLPDWLDAVKRFFIELPDRLRRFFLEEFPSTVKDFLKNAWDWLSENVGKPVIEGVQAIFSKIEDAVRGFFRSVVEFYRDLVGEYERGGFEAVLERLLPLMVAGLGIAVVVDIVSLKIVGSGIDPQAIRQFLDRTVFKFVDLELFTSVFLAIAVQKPLEYVTKRMFRTERPSPGDALRFLSKNLITEEEALSYLQIAGYPDEIARVYLRSIYREPPFEAVFAAYKRGKIDEREYRTWLSILNIDRAETLSGTLYPYKVLEEAAYRLPSPFLIAQAMETGEVSEDVLRRMLEYDLVHPEFVDVMVNALKWRALRDERSLLRRYIIDLFSEGSLKLDEFQHYLGVLGVAPDLMKSIVEVADLNRRKTIRRRALSYLERQFLEGYMDRNEFTDKLVSYGFDEELVREYVALLEYVRDNYMVVKETKDERSSLKSSLVNKYKRGLLTDEELEQELRKLNLNDIEIALTVARAKLEFDAEQKEILFNDLIERLKQGRLSKSEFTDQCQRLGIRYERCMAYADYYWSKYIGDEFLVITKDERSALASAYLKKFTMGFMTEEELREKLKKLMYTDEEIALRIERALVEDEVKYLSDVLTEADALLKKGEISPEEYVSYLVSLGMRQERAEARMRRVLAGVKRR
ncbi:MAG: hypothetical protein LM564_00205 [Desulfurococcaceae archaeon]|nr:hypothetical protein [Desulfurococcaceae archaeon]